MTTPQRAQSTVWSFLILWLCILSCFIQAQTVADCKVNGPTTTNGKPTCTQCADGFFRNPDGTYCYGCSLNCKSCSSTLACDTCRDGAYMLNGDCISCGPNCNKCDGNKCVGCKERYGLVGTECQNCPSGCLRCTDTTHCTQCEAGYLLLDSAGKKTCSLNFDNVTGWGTIIWLISFFICCALMCGCGYCMYMNPPATVKDINEIKMEKMRQKDKVRRGEDPTSPPQSQSSGSDGSYRQLNKQPIKTRYSAHASQSQLNRSNYADNPNNNLQNGSSMFNRPRLALNTIPANQQQQINYYPSNQQIVNQTVAPQVPQYLDYYNPQLYTQQPQQQIQAPIPQHPAQYSFTDGRPVAPSLFTSSQQAIVSNVYGQNAANPSYYNGIQTAYRM